MKKQLITTTTIALLATCIIFSCKKKDDTTPEETTTTTTTTSGSTTSSTTGGSTTSGGTTGGSTTNTLVLNTWQKKKGTLDTTFIISTKSASVGSGNTVHYTFQAAGMPGENITIRLGGTSSATTTPSGNYTVIAWTNTVVPAANQAVILSAGFGAYKSVATSGVLSVTNNTGSINIKGTNMPMVDFVQPTQTLVISTNLQY